MLAGSVGAARWNRVLPRSLKPELRERLIRRRMRIEDELGLFPKEEERPNVVAASWSEL
jgi:hypothetical protein